MKTFVALIALWIILILGLVALGQVEMAKMAMTGGIFLVVVIFMFGGL